ncbi:MAG: pyridoxamine 5'-phosphate oxidase family protein [Nitrosopumilus sp.]|nr:pyridoxamine 5'-phosphate oxidase family protein [Nitrosopumilus sp.]
MNKFSKIEEKFLQSLEEARIATLHADIPHVKPVSYIYHDNIFFIATDYETRTFKNIKINPKVSLAIDVYVPGKHRAVCIQGTAEILEQGKEFLDAYKIFTKKFAWVRNEPWKENEAPILKITVNNRISWGLE